MATVTLIDYTGKGRSDEQWHAADMLIFTKSTRLEMSPGLLDKVKAMSEEEKQKELDYMSKTIPSSWEFADLTFLVSGLSLPAAQQMTRTRNGSYAMQSQRVTDVSEMEVVNPYEPGSYNADRFNLIVNNIKCEYTNLIAAGSSLQDARGVLPRNTTTNIVCKYNLRNFVQLIAARSSLRVQGEYSDVADQMKAAVLEAWPWAEAFFRHPQEAALEILERVVADLGMDVGKGPAWEIAKAMDLIRKGN